MFKVCSKCRNKKDVSEFYEMERNSQKCYSCWCNNCRKAYAKENKEALSKTRKAWYRSKPRNRLNANISNMMLHSIKNNRNSKGLEKLVGYTLQELIIHLENQFRYGMTWSNYGKNGWHIDHIKSRICFNFDSYDDNEFKKCWSLENLQPLWALENMKKGFGL